MSTILAAEGLIVEFPMQGRRERFRAVEDVDIALRRGEILAVVGESGSGKTTTARVLAGLRAATAGTLELEGKPLPKRRDAATKLAVQMVFQDPGQSLNPALRIGSVLTELLSVHKLVEAGRIEERCVELLDQVGLPARVLKARPREISGGQRQRVAIARALAVEPRVLIADEAVASLDYSVRAGVLNLLNDLNEELGLSMIFISHDLGIVERIADRVIVMQGGRVVEEGETAEVFSDPKNEYTRTLLAASPRLVLGEVGS